MTKRVAGIIGAILGGVATLITAVAALVSAMGASDGADTAHAKATVSFELVRQRVEYLAAEFERERAERKEDLARIEDRVEYAELHARVAEALRVHAGRRPGERSAGGRVGGVGARRPASRAVEAELDDALDELLGEGASDSCEDPESSDPECKAEEASPSPPPTPRPPAPIQQTAPGAQPLPKSIDNLVKKEMNDNKPTPMFSVGDRVAVAVINNGANVREIRRVTWNENAKRWEYDVGMLIALPEDRLGRVHK